MTPIVILNRWALGDTVCLSAAVRDLERAHPGRFRVSMAGHYLSYWKHDPHVHPIDPGLGAPVHELVYKAGIHASNTGAYRMHFLTWMHHWLGRQLRVEVPVTEPRGVIHLPPDRDRRVIPGRYWVVMAGGKTDMTAKWWPFARYQQVVTALAARGIRCVQAGANFNIHVHPRLSGCTSMVGRTDDIADLFALIKYSDGVICGITSGLHIAAAYERPCVVIAGGREEPTWEAYTNAGQWPAGCAPVRVPHRFLHTVTLLDCCRQFGCWKKRTVAIEPADTASVDRRDQLCKDPVRGKQPTPRCMTMIEPEHVIEAVMSYYDEGLLPPVEAREPVPAPEGPAAEVATHRPSPQEVPPSAPRTRGEDHAFRVLDHPTIGGRYTLFILCYGDHFDLARKCFESVVNTVPPARLDVRVGLNQVCPATGQFFADMVEAGLVTKIYPDSGARRKYPAMREMFRDPECPIRTRYLIWLDDDAVCVDKKWLPRLTETIIANHPHGSRLYGAKFLHDLAMYARNGHRPDLWFRGAPWWRGADLHLRGGASTAPNGSAIPFVSGWFWALATEMIARADIPDARLNHNGGDITLGAQVHQAGGKIKSFNDPRSMVWCPSREKGGRRGYSERFPWDPQSGQATKA